jgi:hypothetical protein
MIESLIPVILVILVVALLLWIVESTLGAVLPPIKIGIMVLIGIFIIIYVARVLGIKGV